MHLKSFLGFWYFVLYSCHIVSSVLRISYPQTLTIQTIIFCLNLFLLKNIIQTTLVWNDVFPVISSFKHDLLFDSYFIPDICYLLGLTTNFVHFSFLFVYLNTSYFCSFFLLIIYIVWIYFIIYPFYFFLYILIILLHLFLQFWVLFWPISTTYCTKGHPREQVIVRKPAFGI